MNVWWKALVTVGTDVNSNQQVVDICEDVEKNDIWCLVKCCVWYHPYEVVVSNIVRKDFSCRIQELFSLYSKYEEHVVAIWEMWIDLHYKNAKDSLFDQQELLAFQCDLALQLWLPVVIHSRDAFEETMAVLQDFPDLVTYFHCWWYDPSCLDFLFGMIDEVYVWFCGNVSYKNADNLRESLSVVPKNSLLLETDAPYLTVQSQRWKINAPAKVSLLYEYVSEFLWMEVSDLVAMVWNNFRSLYHVL